MKKVFVKILEHKKSVDISICDPRHHRGFGWNDMIGESPLRWSTCFIESLDNTLVAAIRANCHVRTLELSMHHYRFDEIHDAVEDLFSPTRPPLKLIINCRRKRTHVLRWPYTIPYDQADQSLNLDGCDVYELAIVRNPASIRELLNFLLAQTTQLILENCHLCSEGRFAAFLAMDETKALSRNLTSVRMQNFLPCRSTDDVARRHWSGILRVLARYAGLKHFSIESLDYAWAWALFHLPPHTRKHELSGDDMAEQLEAFAAVVATELETDESSSDEDVAIESDDN